MGCKNSLVVGSKEEFMVVIKGLWSGGPNEEMLFVMKELLVGWLVVGCDAGSIVA